MSTLLFQGSMQTGYFRLGQVSNAGGSTVRIILNDVPDNLIGRYGYFLVSILGAGPSEYDRIKTEEIHCRSTRIDLRQVSLPTKTYFDVFWWRAEGGYRVYLN